MNEQGNPKISPCLTVRRSNNIFLCIILPEAQLCISQNVIFKKYKTFSVLIYSYINTSGNWKNEKLCGNTTPAGRSFSHNFEFFQFSRVLI